MADESLNQQASDWETLANLYQLQSVLTRMKRNLQLIDEAPNAQIITVVGGDLFQLAMKYYGDATYWTTIAQANISVLLNSDGFVDPRINGIQTLLLPPKPATSNGGLMPTA